MEIDIIIYVNTVKKYFEKNPEFSDYIIGNNELDFFYENVTKYAKKNHEKTGDYRINKEQFEHLRKCKKIKDHYIYGDLKINLN